MKWTDVRLIAIELAEAHPEVDPKNIRFTDLHNWVLALKDFHDDTKHGGEKVLEAIQAAWIDEVE
jgi:FeS assembly protein IscX